MKLMNTSRGHRGIGLAPLPDAHGRPGEARTIQLPPNEWVELSAEDAKSFPAHTPVVAAWIADKSLVVEADPVKKVEPEPEEADVMADLAPKKKA